MKKIFGYFKLFGIICFGLILYNLEYSDIRESMAAVSLKYIFIYVLLFLASFLLKYLRFHHLVLSICSDTTWSKIFGALIESSFWGNITPGRLGEASKLVYMDSWGIKAKTSMAIVFLERIFDMAFYLGFGFLSLLALKIFRLLPELPIKTGNIVEASFLLMLVIILFSVAYKQWRLRDKLSSLIAGFSGFKNELRKLFSQNGNALVVYTFACTILTCFQICILAMAFSISVPVAVLVATYLASSLIALLPISINGIGTREATYVLLLSQYEGIEKIFLFSFFDGILFPLVSYSILYAGYEVFKKTKLNKDMPKAIIR